MNGILPALRGQRYGSRALSMLPNDRPVILEIDPPVDEIAIRRKGFYERCGFTRTRIRMCIRRTTRAFVGMIWC